MRLFAKRITLPVLLFVGLVLLGTQVSDAGVVHRRARRAYGHQLYHAAPTVVYTPPVRVYTPPVRVYAPAVRVHVAPSISPFYGYSYYYGW